MENMKDRNYIKEMKKRKRTKKIVTRRQTRLLSGA
jgi:hypothetical protein